MQQNNAIVTDLNQAFDSKTGWVYCLRSKCGKYSKIGKTNLPDLKSRLSTRSKREYYSEMIFVFAVRDARKEKFAHSLFDEKRCRYKSHAYASSVDHYSIEKDDAFTIAVIPELFVVSHHDVFKAFEENGLFNETHNDEDVTEWDARRVKGGGMVSRSFSFSLEVIEELDKHPNQPRFITNLVKQHIASRERSQPALTRADSVLEIKTRNSELNNQEYSVFDFMRGIPEFFKAAA